ncbi:hypothetical protein [Peribacillus sp. Hz7]|uniref:hypothetical protein n=1 Tax=Peribacillus sp. Hz7 TaxID=3344873 RepID=UPI0035CB4C3A
MDAGLGAVSLAAGAVVVSIAGMFGAPLVGVAAIGLGASLVTTYLTDGIKIGKDEKNLSDGLKDGVQKGIKTVAGWMK